MAAGRTPRARSRRATPSRSVAPVRDFRLQRRRHPRRRQARSAIAATWCRTSGDLEADRAAAEVGRPPVGRPAELRPPRDLDPAVRAQGRRRAWPTTSPGVPARPDDPDPERLAVEQLREVGDRGRRGRAAGRRRRHTGSRRCERCSPHAPRPAGRCRAGRRRRRRRGGRTAPRRPGGRPGMPTASAGRLLGGDRARHAGRPTRDQRRIMAHYQAMGEHPAEAAHPASSASGRGSGELYYEELMGEEGVSPDSSLALPPQHPVDHRRSARRGPSGRPLDHAQPTRSPPLRHLKLHDLFEAKDVKKHRRGDRAAPRPRQR